MLGNQEITAMSEKSIPNKQDGEHLFIVWIPSLLQTEGLKVTAYIAYSSH